MKTRLKICLVFVWCVTFFTPAWSQKKDIPQFTQAEIDSTSYLVGVNFGAFIKTNALTQINYERMKVGMSDFMIAQGSPDDENFHKQFTYDPREMSDYLDLYAKKKSHTQVEIDKASYLLGVNFGSFIKGYDFPGLDYSTMSNGINDFLAAKGEASDDNYKKQFKYDPEKISDVFNRALAKQRSITASSIRLQADEFLQKNASVYGVKELNSGLQYKVVSPGNARHPSKDSQVKVLYTATLLDGTVIDSATDRANPVELSLDKVIAGWQEGLQYVGEGGHIVLYVPDHLAYGEQGNGKVLPGALSIYDIELINVLSNVQAAPTPPVKTSPKPSSSATRIAYGKEITINVGESVQVKHPEGMIERWEENGQQIVKMDATNVLTGKTVGTVTLWGYIGSSPKLIKVTVKKSGSTSASSSTSYSSSTSGTQTSTVKAAPSSSMTHGVPRIINAKSFTLRVGETITIQSNLGGEVTGLEQNGGSKIYSINGKNTISGIREGTGKLWVYVDGSPKLFDVKVSGHPSRSASSAGIPMSDEKNITIPVNGMIKLKHPEGQIHKYECTNDDVAAVFANGVVIGLKEGNTSIWCYVNGSPKLYYISVSNTATRTKGSSVYTPSTSSRTSSTASQLRVAYGKDVTIRVGEKVQLKSTEGTVEKWENNGKNSAASVNSTGVVTGVREGDAVVWGYIQGSPKLFRIKVVR